MHRYAIVSVICIAGCTTSPVYFPGLHPSAPLGSKGSVSASYVLKAPRGSELHVAALVSDRWFISGRHSSTDDGPDLGGSHSDLALGRVTRDSSGQTQHAIGFSEGDGRASIGSFLDWAKYEGAPYRAFGSYKRLYMQRAATRMFGRLEVGGSARLSYVKVIDYRRLGGTMHANRAVGGPYNRDTTFTGKLTGVFAEPALFFGLNFQGIRVTPQLSFAMPLSPTAFGAIPVEAGVTFAIDSDVFQRWLRR